MLRVENSVVINQPIEEVFAFVSKAENDPLWQAQIQEARTTSDGPFGVGSRTAQKAHFLGRGIDTVGEITEYEQNRIIAWKSISGAISGEGQSIFEVTGDGQTKYTIIADFDIGGFFKLAEPIVARSARRQTEANLANLKDILEAETDKGE